jgi:hypothetical protein
VTQPFDADRLPASISKRIVADEHGCWIWTGARQSKGYGNAYSTATGVRLAHRLTYELLVGPIPDGLELDHLCRVRHCVNPAHLEPVTHCENVLRGESPTAKNAPRIKCINGHPFDAQNTRRVPGGARRCRACARERQQRPEAVAKKSEWQRKRRAERRAERTRSA